MAPFLSNRRINRAKRRSNARLVCLAGKGRRPPEDCGGIWGYYRLLEILRNPNDPEHSDMKEWAGGEIDPEKFDLAEINAALAHFRK